MTHPMIRLLASMLLLVVSLCACAMTASQPQRQPAARPAGGPTVPTPPPTAQPARPMLALWINRWDYRTQQDVDDAISRAASLGVTDIFWQVRGQADAFYPSALEPWGEEICDPTPAGLRPPGFDPLRRAIDQSRARGIRLHAWVNAMPLWRGKNPPADRRHIFHAKPGWRIRQADGTPQQLHDHYVIVNFARRDVQDHIVAVCKDILTRYDVDGLHLDYIRYVSETFDAKVRFMQDSETLAQFGRDARVDPASLDARQLHARMHAWRTNLVTMLVRRIRTEAMPARPGAALSAAVWRSPTTARDTYAQDAARWLNEGLLDFACPMIYTDKNDDFDRDLSEWSAAAPGKRIIPGLGIYMHAPGASKAQLASSRQQSPSGLALYAYASLWESADPKQDKRAKSVQERLDRLAAIRADLAPRR